MLRQSVKGKCRGGRKSELQFFFTRIKRLVRFSKLKLLKGLKKIFGNFSEYFKIDSDGLFLPNQKSAHIKLQC